MTSKERILTVLQGKIPDRVPICLFVQQEYLSYYFNKVETSRIVDAVALAKELDFDVLTRDTFHIQPYFFRKSYPNWKVEKSEELIGDIMHRNVVITTPEGKLTQVEVAPYDPSTISGIHFTTKKYLLEDLDTDYVLFRKYLPKADKSHFEEMLKHANWVVNEVGDAGLACPWGMGGVYNFATTLRSIEDMMVDPYEDEEAYHDMMQFFTDMIVQDYEWMCDTPYQMMGLQANIANAGVMSLGFFEEYVMPYEEQILKAIKKRGKFSLYHNCGIARGLYPAYAEMNMTLFETLSPAPQGDNILSEAKELLGKNHVLSGNLDQISFLKTASVSEVENATIEIINTMKENGNYIFACSDYLEKETPLDNVKAVISAAKSVGYYTK